MDWLLDAAKSRGIDYEVRTGLKGDALREALSQFEGAICRSGVKITADALAGNTKLRAIVRAGVGTDNIDKDAATRQGIVVMNTPAGNTLSTAEHTFTLMLALSRNVAPAYQGLIEKRWDRAKFMGTQLAEKTLGVIGLGRIGLAVAKRAQAFEMKVIGFDPFLSREKVQDLGLEPVGSIKEMLPKIDYLTVHTPFDRRDSRDHQQRNPQAPQARRAVDQLRPRRHLRRSGLGRRTQVGSPRRRRARCVCHGTVHPTARCLGCRVCCARRTSGRAPKKLNHKLPSKG